MSEGRVTRQSNVKPTDLIIIDSDEEDEVIFVNEDGGSTLAQTPALVTPGFLENLPKTNDTEVRSLFDNVVKIPAETNSNPIVIERAFPESPTDEFDEEQIELPNYNVQFLNKSNDPSSLENNSNDEDANETSQNKPLIKLAPISKLVSKPAFVSLDQIVNDLGVKTPQIQVRKVKKKKEEKDPLDITETPKIKSRIVYKSPVNSKASSSSKSELAEKFEILQKFIPGSSAEPWPRDHTLRRTINFIMELRKSDCELDIAEEALMQSNIKLTMDYERILTKVYNLCPKEEEQMMDVSSRKTRNNSRRDSNTNDNINISNSKTNSEAINQIGEADVSMSLNQKCPIKCSNSVASTNKECLFLNNLLGQVRESAKTHLLNFDPDIPFDDFLPTTLLNWDRPKTKTDILDEIMYLENAISKCNSESEEIRKVSHQQEVFKYEDLFVTFKKEFDLGINDKKFIKKDSNNFDIVIENSEMNLPEVKEDIISDGDVKDIDVKEEVDDVKQVTEKLDSVKVKTKKKSDKTFSRRKRTPWNKGLKGYKKKKFAKKYIESKSSNLEFVNINSDDEITSAVDESNDCSEPVHIKEDPVKMTEDKEIVDVSTSLNNDSLKGVTKPKNRAKRKSSLRKLKKGKQLKKRVGKKLKIIEVETVPLETKDDITFAEERSSKDDEINEKKTESANNNQINEDEDEIPLDQIIQKLKMPIIKLVREKEGIVTKIVSSENVFSKLSKNENKTKQAFEEPAKRKKLLKAKYAEGARTTRSFVKRCSEVMDQVDKEMEVFLRKNKRVDIDEFGENASEQLSADASVDIAENSQIKNEGNLVEQSDENDLQVNDLKVDEVTASEPVKNLNETTHKIIISPRKKKKSYYTGKSKRKARKGKTKAVKSNAFTEPLLAEQKESTDEQNNLMTASSIRDSPLSPEVDSSEVIMPEPSTKNNEMVVNVGSKNDNHVEEGNDDGPTQIISSCFSIDPLLFDNLDSDNFDEIPKKDESKIINNVNIVDDNVNLLGTCEDPLEAEVISNNNENRSIELKLETPEHLTTAKPEMSKNINQDASPSTIDVPASPLALTVKPSVSSSPKSSVNDQTVHMSDTPLDFSMKADLKTKLKVDSLDMKCALPLNLSNKTCSLNTPPDSQVLDFSYKNKLVSPTKEVELTKGESAPFNLTKPVGDNLQPNNLNYLAGVPVTMDQPKTPFTSGKQVFTDPKDFKVCSIPDTSTSVVEAAPIALSSQTDRGSSVPQMISVPHCSSPAPPVKDSIINEITDILVDLAGETTQDHLNFGLENSSGNKTPDLVQSQIPTLSQSNTDSDNNTSGVNCNSGSTDLNVASNEQDSMNVNVKYSKPDLDVPSHSSNTASTPVYTTSLTQPCAPFGTLSQSAQPVPNFGNFNSTRNQELGSDGRHATVNSTNPTDFPSHVGSTDVGQVQSLQNFPNVNSSTHANNLPNSCDQSEQNYSQTVQAHAVFCQNSVEEPGEIEQNHQPLSTAQSNLQQTQFINSPRFEQASNQIVPYDSQVANKVDQSIINMNDPRILKQFSQESYSEGEKQWIAYCQQGLANLRDPRLTRKLLMGGSSPSNLDAPFSGNLQINQLISDVIKHNNFENFLLNSKSNQIIMNQNLDIDEEDLNLNRSDFDDFDDSDEVEDEDKQRQSLLRRSIDKLIVTDLNESTQNVKTSQSVKQHSTNKKEFDSSDESVHESSFSRRVLRSPPMIKKSSYDDDDDHSDEVLPKVKKRNREIYSRDNCDRKPPRSTRGNVKYTENEYSDENSHSSSGNEEDEFKYSSMKRKLSMKEYLKRNKQRRPKEDFKHKSKTRESDDEYSPIKKHSGGKRIKKRIIDSDDESQVDRSSQDELPLDKYLPEGSDNKVEEDRSELSDEVSDHLKRVSDIKHRKLEGKEKRVITSKRDPQVRRMKFLDELPAADVNVNKEIVLSSNKKYSDRNLSKMEKQLVHRRDHSPKSTSKVVRKTITTERIVTKRIGGDLSSTSKKMKSGPEKEKKVFVQERITLKVNERSNLDRKGINFKCDALKEGEILKVVGGKLVRVRKRMSNSDEEVERERTKLQKCLNSFKIKKKADKNVAADVNPYTVLKDDPKLQDLDKSKPSLDKSNSVKGSDCPQDKKISDESKAQNVPEKIRSSLGIVRSNSTESIDCDVKKSPIRMRPNDPRRFSRCEGMSPKNLSPGNINISPRMPSSPNLGHFENTNRIEDSTVLVKRPSMEIAQPDLSNVTGNEIASTPTKNSSVALKPNMEVASKPLVESDGVGEGAAFHDEGLFARRFNMEMGQRSNFELVQNNQGLITRKTNMEILRRPDMEVTRKSDFDVATGSNLDAARRSDLEIARNIISEISQRSDFNASRKSNEMFSRRESFTLERRRSRDGGFSRREFSRESRQETVVSEWSTEKKQEERSIFGLLQKGVINIQKSSPSEVHAWNSSDPRGGMFDPQRRTESLPLENDMRNNFNRYGELDDISHQRDWRESLAPPKGGVGPSRNMRDERSYRGQSDDRQFSQPSHLRNDERHFRGQNKEERPFHQDNRPPLLRNPPDDDRPFHHDDRHRNRDERAQFHNDERDRPSFLQAPDWSRESERDQRFHCKFNWQQEGRQQEKFRDQKFRNNPQYREVPPFRGKWDYRRSPDRFRQTYNDPGSSLLDRRLENKGPPTHVPQRGAPHSRHQYQSSRPSWK